MDSCSPATGCSYVAVTCAAPDACHDAGTCNPATGACFNPAKANGTACDLDSSQCTQALPSPEAWPSAKPAGVLFFFIARHSSRNPPVSFGKVEKPVVPPEAARLWNVPSLVTLPPFYDEPGFARAFAAVGRPLLHEFHPDFILFSYHGLPESQVRKGDESGAHCLRSEGCCDGVGTVNRNCYRAQCYAPSRRLAAELGTSETPCRTSWVPNPTDLPPSLARGRRPDWGP